MKRGRNAGTGRFDAVLFDLDGTLVDTAPDMVGVLLEMQESRGQQPVDYDVARNHVSNGAIGLLRIAFPDASDDMLGELHREFLDGYQQNLCINSSIFSPLDSLLDEFDSQHIPWGIVTNKPEAMTIPLLDALKIRRSAACIVSGDTLPERKPNPAPLLFAAEQIPVAPARSIYVGDAYRDIEAGKAAGMTTIAVGYGYITPAEDPNDWGADVYAADTMALVDILRTALRAESND